MLSIQVGEQVLLARITRRSLSTLQLERGNPEFAVAAERMAVPVPGTGLRAAAAVPARTINPFGLDPVPSVVWPPGPHLATRRLDRVNP